MPLRIAGGSRALRQTHVEKYVCPSCLLRDTFGSSLALKRPARAASTSQKRASLAPRPRRTQSRSPQQPLAYIQTRRYSSNGTLASSSAINAPSTVPPELRDLHRQLQLLQDKASSFVNLSRLQLLLRSLESHDPVIRIAFLGLGNQGIRAARKLAKVLLADELGEEADWEKKLMGVSEGQSVLLKYGEPGEDAGVQQATPSLMQELKIPSLRLRRWNVEILVKGWNAAGYAPSKVDDSATELEDSLLAPPVTIPGAGGRVGFVRYPVHKALIVAEGVSGIIEFGKLPSSVADGELIAAALSLPLGAKATTSPADEASHANAVSIELADQAVNIFRLSNANGAAYSEQWQRSRVGTISTWLSNASQRTENKDNIKPAVHQLLRSILARTEHAISSAESSAKASSLALDAPDSKRTALLSAIASWSEQAHQDLQMNLGAALASPNWRRTTWWRLFWRIDEVSLSAGDVLLRGWLVEAEQSLAFLSGRLLEAGLGSEEDLKGETVGAHENPTPVAASGLLDERMEKEVGDYKATQSDPARQHAVGTVAELLQLPPMLARIREQTGLNALFNPPWPQTIHLARQQLLHQRVPAMHRHAQALMLASLSTIGGSGALAVWLWVASGGVALYEAGAVAALGLVWALRRLQKKWSAERNAFTRDAREDARRVLADVQARLTRLAQDGGRVAVREEDVAEWREARAAVEACVAAMRVVDRRP